MERYQKILNEIFPNRYVIADSWDEKDPEYDRFGIYEIAYADRRSEPAQLLDRYTRYSPDMVIWETVSKWFFLYTEKPAGAPQTLSDPCGSPEDFDYVEHPEHGNSRDEIFIRVVEFIAGNRAKEYLFADSEN